MPLNVIASPSSPAVIGRITFSVDTDLSICASASVNIANGSGRARTTSAPTSSANSVLSASANNTEAFRLIPSRIDPIPTRYAGKPMNAATPNITRPHWCMRKPMPTAATPRIMPLMSRPR